MEKVKDPRKVEGENRLLDDNFRKVVEREVTREILQNALQANPVGKREIAAMFWEVAEREVARVRNLTSKPKVPCKQP